MLHHHVYHKQDIGITSTTHLDTQKNYLRKGSGKIHEPEEEECCEMLCFGRDTAITLMNSR